MRISEKSRSGCFAQLADTSYLLMNLRMIMCFGFATNVALALHFQCIQLGKQRFAVTEYFTGFRVEINLVKDLLNGEVNHVKFYGDSFLAYSGIVYLDFCSDPTPSPICGPDALTPH